MYAAPTPVVVTNHPKGVNALGVAGMIVGIIALLTAWIPFCGIGALPLALIGGLLAGIGLFAALASGKTTMTFPIAGLVVSLLAAALSVFWIFVMSASVQAAKQQAAEQRARAAGQQFPARNP